MFHPRDKLNWTQTSEHRYKGCELSTIHSRSQDRMVGGILSCSSLYSQHSVQDTSIGAPDEEVHGMTQLMEYSVSHAGADPCTAAECSLSSGSLGTAEISGESHKALIT